MGSNKLILIISFLSFFSFLLLSLPHIADKAILQSFKMYQLYKYLKVTSPFKSTLKLVWNCAICNSGILLNCLCLENQLGRMIWWIVCIRIVNQCLCWSMQQKVGDGGTVGSGGLSFANSLTSVCEKQNDSSYFPEWFLHEQSMISTWDLAGFYICNLKC